MSNRYMNSVKPQRIALFGKFGAGNLGNECTLQVIIEQILRRWPDAQFVCFCANPQDVRTRHGIAAFPSQAQAAAAKSGPRGRLERTLRMAFLRMPLELVHWVKTLYVMGRTDMLIVAGTGIVNDYLTGPFGWPYDIFKLATLAALCRVKFVLLSVGVGPIRHPLSRWFLKRTFALAYYRSYRDEASKQYMENIGFNTVRDFVYPDVVFGLVQSNQDSVVRPGQRRIVGLGLQGLWFKGAEGVSGIPGYDGGLRVLAPGAWLLCAAPHRRHAVRYTGDKGIHRTPEEPEHLYRRTAVDHRTGVDRQ